MAEVPKDLDGMIAKIKSVAPMFQAFADMKEVMDFLGNNKGLILKHTTEMARMTKEIQEKKSSVDLLYKQLDEAQTKLGAVESTYSAKTKESEEKYREALEVARVKYMGERDDFISENRKIKKEITSEKDRLSKEVSDLRKELQELQEKYDSLKERFK